MARVDEAEVCVSAGQRKCVAQSKKPTMRPLMTPCRLALFQNNTPRRPGTKLSVAA